MLKSNETVHPGQITPNVVKALISLVEKPNLTRLIMQIYDLTFSFIEMKRKPNRLKIQITPPAPRVSFDRLILLVNKSTNELERLDMVQWSQGPKPKKIGIDFAFDDDLKYIQNFNGERVFFLENVLFREQ